MPIFRFLTLVIASVASAGVAAQTSEPAPQRNAAVVNKCVAADGSVTFSDQPCSADPKKIQKVDTTGALRTGSGGHVGEIADSVSDSDCHDRAHKGAYANVAADIEQSNQHIADYQKQLSDLSAPGVYLMDNANNPVDDAVKHTTIEGLNLAIQREREYQVKANANAATAYQAALDGCAQEKAQRATSPKDKKP
jgi:hypothetical protein